MVAWYTEPNAVCILCLDFMSFPITLCGLMFSVGVTMKFFLPAASSDAQAEEVWTSIRKFAEQTTSWPVSSRRIFSIDYCHDGKDGRAEVGQDETDIREPVIAILESNTYLVCTPNRGVLRGIPRLVGHNEVRCVVYFDDSPK